MGAALRAGAPAEAYNRRLLKYYVGQTDKEGDADGDGDRDWTGEGLGNTIANATASFILHDTDQEIIIRKKTSSCGTMAFSQAFDYRMSLASIRF